MLAAAVARPRKPILRGNPDMQRSAVAVPGRDAEDLSQASRVQRGPGVLGRLNRRRLLGGLQPGNPVLQLCESGAEVVFDRLGDLSSQAVEPEPGRLLGDDGLVRLLFDVQQVPANLLRDLRVAEEHPEQENGAAIPEGY